MKKFWSLFFIGVIIYFLSIGFSSFSNEALLSNVLATFRLQDELRVTEFGVDSSTNSGVSSWEDYNVNRIMTGIVLPNQNATVTYRVKVVNLSAIVAQISNINGLQSNLTYELTNYNLGDHICNTNNVCKSGIEKEFLITIKYKSNGYDSTNNPSGNYIVNLEFVWSYNYTVTFNPNGGNQPSFTTKTVTYNESYGNLPTVTRTGYTFTGWFTSASGGTRVNSTTTVTTTNDHPLFAHWESNTYTITLVDLYASVGGDAVFYEVYDEGFYNENMDEATEVSVPEVTGYDFLGYYTLQGGGGTQIIDFDGTIIVDPDYFTSDMDLFAYYELAVYSCLAGQYLPAGATACAQCSAGYYCPSIGQYQYNTSTDQGRTKCPGSMTSVAGSDEKTDCKITCSATTYLAKSASACTSCTAGNECSGTTCYYSDSSTCGISACAAGKYSLAGASACTTCVAGTYANGTGNSSCTVCGGGKTSTAGTTASSSCTDCTAITGSTAWATPTWSNDNTISNLCKSSACAAGYRLNSGTCTQCTAGTYAVAGSSSCTACTTGSYSAAGAGACTVCQASGATGGYGTTSGTGQSSCNATCGKSNASTWETSSWNSSDNTTSNICIIKTCASNYTLSNNTCVRTTRTITLNGTRTEVVNITATDFSTSVTIGSDGTKSVSVPTGSVTFTGATTGLTKTVSITTSTTNVYIPRAIYWRGTTFYTKGSLGSWTVQTSNPGYVMSSLSQYSDAPSDSPTHKHQSGAVLDSNRLRYGWMFVTSDKVSTTGYSKLWVNGYYKGAASNLAYYYFGLATEKTISGSQPGTYGATVGNLPQCTSNCSASDASKSFSGISSAYIFFAVFNHTSENTASVTSNVYKLWLE